MGIIQSLFGSGQSNVCGVFERVWNQTLAQRQLVNDSEIEGALKSATSGTAPKDGWGIHFMLINDLAFGGLEGVFIWLPSKREMIYFFAFLALHPRFFGVDAISVGEKKPESCVRTPRELQTILDSLAGVKSAGEKELALVNQIYCPTVLWFGSFAELSSGNTKHATETRQHFRAACSGQLSAKAKDFSAAAITHDEIGKFTKCFDWSRVKLQIY